MADLLDIAPSTSCEAVRLNDGERLVVRGLNGNAIAAIVARFPDLGILLGGGAIGVNVPRLIGQFGHAIGPIIAAGIGHLGEEKYEQRANELSVEDQIDLINAIIGLTFRKGLVSFVEKLAALLTGADEGAKPVRVRLKKSPSPSQLSSDAASHPNMQ